MITEETIQALVVQLEIAHSQATSYMNRHTYEIFETLDATVDGEFDGEFDGEYDEELDDETDEDDSLMPESVREARRKLREIECGDDWIRLPSSFDVHEWSIMQDFALTVDVPRVQEKLLDGLHRKGAFRRFKEEVSYQGLDNKWYAYKAERLREIILEWLKRNGIK